MAVKAVINGWWRWFVAALLGLTALIGCSTHVQPVVNPPMIEAFAADDDTVPIGTTTILRWTVTDADSIVIDDGTGALALEPDTTSLEVNPTTETTYTLTATNIAGEANATVSVAVSIAPSIAPSIANLTHEILLESRVRLTWTASDAEGFTVYAVTDDGDAAPTSARINGTSREATVAIPVAARQTLRVCAVATGFEDACQDSTLNGVVTTAADWDPYFLEGFEPEPEIPGSLRSVILAAAPGSVIGFAADVTEIPLRGVDLLQLGIWQDAHLILTKDLTISGPPGGVTFRGVSAAGPDDPGDPFTYRSRLIYVVPGVTVHLDGLIVTGGTFIFRGGAIRNDGDLTISRSRIVGNRAWLTAGGIFNQSGAVLRVEDSVLEGNQAVTEIDEIGQTYAIRGGYVVCMTRSSYGGGLFNAAGAVATFVDTPIRGNQATVSGGGVYNQGDLTLIRSPVTGNIADHTVFTNDPSYPAPPDYEDHPVCPVFNGPFTPTSLGGGIYQAVGATLELIDSPLTDNQVGNLFTAIGATSALQDVDVDDPDRRGSGADTSDR